MNLDKLYENFLNQIVDKIKENGLEDEEEIWNFVSENVKSKRKEKPDLIYSLEDFFIDVMNKVFDEN